MKEGLQLVDLINVGEEFLWKQDSDNTKDAYAVEAVVPRGILF